MTSDSGLYNFTQKLSPLAHYRCNPKLIIINGDHNVRDIDMKCIHNIISHIISLDVPSDETHGLCICMN
uniref:Uncharacterized protein n=1 Tax=Heterorhabditis bacteriophora TaxID=37862 RepID=A0A1I7XCY6_HETBA